MNSTLFDFLQSVRADGENFTHTSKLDPKGRFLIPDNKVPKFNSLLCKNNKLNVEYAICEKPYKIGPLRQDFDFRFKLEHGLRRVYSYEDIKSIHRIYCKVLKKACNPSKFQNKMLYCVVSEKPEPRQDGDVIKDGLHFFFPFLYCNGWFNDVYVPNEVTKMMKEEKLFATEKYMESIDTVIDRKISTKVWMMYGSVSKEGSAYYKATHFLNEKSSKMKITQTFKHFFETERNKSPYYYLPLLMSIRKQKIPEIELTDVVLSKNKPPPKTHIERKTFNTKNEADILTNLLQIEGDIMRMLSQHRCDNYDDWMDIGWTLHSISQGHEKGLDIWIDFSERSEKFKIGECEKLWDKMDCDRKGHEGKPKTIGTIFRLAKLDSPEKYKEWHDNMVEDTIEESLMCPKPTHQRIALVLHKYFQDIFICSSCKNSMWWEYKNNAWEYMDDGITLKRILPTIIAQKYGAYQKKLSEQYDKYINNNQNDLAKQIQTKITKVWKVVEFIENKSNVNAVIEMSKPLFYVKDFHKTLDKNEWLIGDQNGVYDLRNGKHRTGVPDDRISRKMGAEYVDYTWEDQDVIDAMDHINKVFVNPNIRGYWLRATAACMQAGNVNKKCYIWTNDSGDNAKTVTLEIVQDVFGDYFLNFDRNRFIKNTMKSAGGPSPDIKRMDCRRIGAVKELAKNEPLDIGFFKFVTGNDSMYVRSHHEEGEDMTPQLTLIIMCNKPPPIPGNDEATWNRLRKIAFESTFNNDAPDDIEEQFRQKHFKVDVNFKKKMAKLTNAFYWIFLQAFKEYLKIGLNEPEEVTIDTEKYKTENDIYRQFSQEKIEDTGKEDDVVTLSEVYAEFQEWFNENYPSYKKNKVGKNHFKHEMEKNKLGKLNEGSKWYGFKINFDA